jgi:hypothetical protein
MGGRLYLLLFTNVRVWDGTSEGTTRRMNVLVGANLIKKIRADATLIDAPGMVSANVTPLLSTFSPAINERNRLKCMIFCNFTSRFDGPIPAVG